MVGDNLVYGNVTIGEDLPLEPGPLPNEKLVRQGWESAVNYFPDLHKHPAPQPPKEWTGREEVLNDLSSDWENPEHLIVGLIGFGGEGKTSIVRSWVHDRLLHKDSPIQI